MGYGKSVVPVALAAFTAAAEAGEWITYVDETAARLSAAPAVGIADVEEKDFAWGDIDQDGDTDLVVVRKQPLDTTGRRTNVLFLNEDGVLVDRTAAYASASNIAGDLGFLTPTNDRDVALADVNGDGWLDVITAVTMSDGLPKVIGHPRVYRNLGSSGGVWQGLRHEDARIPQFFTTGGLPVNPRFNVVAAGDVTGDGLPDLYFGDTDLPTEPAQNDLDDRLLINDGSGTFIDLFAFVPPPMLDSGMTTSAVIADMNDDGFRDIATTKNLFAPAGLFIAYGSGGGFTAYENVLMTSPMFVSAGDLNGDGRLDFAVTDDNMDRVLINNGNGADGLANFLSVALPASSNGFGGNSVISDLDHDGKPDVVIADMDISLPGCNRLLNFYRNNGGSPPAFVDDVPGGFTNADRNGTYDVAVLDIDGDGWEDLVLGQCEGTRVWIAVPPALPCHADLDGSSDVGFSDLTQLLLHWGPCPPAPPCSGDLDGSGNVGFGDLTAMLLVWGSCP